MTKLKSILISHVTKIESPSNVFGTSGIFISANHILTHGSLLYPLFLSSNNDIKNLLSQAKSNNDIITVPDDISLSLKLKVQYNEDNSDVIERSCKLIKLWECNLLNETFDELLYSWTFEKVSKFDKSLLSIFLILKIDNGIDDVDDIKEILRQFYEKHFLTDDNREIIRLKRGVNIEIDASPFGNAAFLNSISRGIVSNVVGKNNCVILTDASAVPGSEGSPVFIGHERKICGLVIAPLSWCRGEWVDYTFAVNLKVCLKNLFKLPIKNKGISLSIQNLTEQENNEFLIDILDKSVVLIKCKSGWGTGVIVDLVSGIILTCSHVVREAVNDRVKISVHPNSTKKIFWASIIYRTRDGQPYDIAVLKFEKFNQLKEYKSNLRAAKLSSDEAKLGEAVISAGFPFFGNFEASVSLGNVSRVSNVILQTTCCVQSGASGGPVISCSTGEVVALIVSNAVSANNSILYPRFNMAVPSIVIKEPVEKYLATGDVKSLKSLCSDDPETQEAWNFYLTPRSKI